MPYPTLHLSPSLEGSSSLTKTAPLRTSLYDSKDDFIGRIAPTATAAIYFGSFSLLPQDSSLSRQALFKLSFLHRHFLQPAGLRVVVQDETAVFYGDLTNRTLYPLAEILALQIDGIEKAKDETSTRQDSPLRSDQVALESLQLLFATDQTLHSGVRINSELGQLTLEGSVTSPAQKNWAEQLAEAVGGDVTSHLNASTFTPPPLLKASLPPALDDESMQALVLYRLRLVPDTARLNVKVKATRGVVTLQGKVPSEAQRQRAENIARSTLGIRELRSSLSVTE